MQKLFSTKRKTLSPGTSIEPYLVRKEVGQDYFGATYIVSHDKEGAVRYQVREFFPASVTKRSKGNVQPAKKAMAAEFEQLRARCGEVYGRLAGLEADHLVTLLDQFDAHNTRYLVAAWPEGATLAEIQQEFGKFSAEQARTLLDCLLPGLKAMHERGVVHGSVSPTTTFRDERGYPVLNMPYGPALLNETPILPVPEAFATAFTAPELATTDTEIGATADVYALGAVLYTVLTDQTPPKAAQRLAALAAGEADPLDSERLRTACGEDTALADSALACLVLDPAERPQTVDALRQLVWPPIFKGEARRPEPAPRTWFTSWGKWAMAAAWLLIAGVGLYFFWPRPTDKPAQPPVIKAEVTPVPDPVPATDPVEHTEPGTAIVSETISETAPVTTDAETDAPAPVDVAASQAWDAAQNADNISAYQSFLTTYGDSKHADAARIRLASVEKARGDLIASVRTALNGLGADLPDGRTMDAALSERIAGFQDEAGLPVTGEVSADLLAVLKSKVAEAAAKTVSTAVSEPATEKPPMVPAESQPQTEQACTSCPDVAAFAAGQFMMGAVPGEPGRNSAEPLPTDTIISAPFSMMTHEVTVGEFTRFVDQSGYRPARGCIVTDPEKPGFAGYRADAGFRAPGYDQAANHPVTCVSARDAEVYAMWLSEQTGKSYRLPTSAEWEYAARAGTTGAYFWGSDPASICRHANGADTSLPAGWITSPCGDGVMATAPVGKFGANSKGLSDMAGNVWEWTSDCYDDQCPVRVVRGGSWASSPDQLRSAMRYSAQGDTRSNTIGFRLVLTE